MHFERIQPSVELESLVNSYWAVHDDSTTVAQQKIIPDDYTEVIFHFADPYRINISGSWAIQSKNLMAGQIGKHFFLENTGRSEMLGVKFQPAAITHLFQLQMHTLKDRVVDLEVLPGAWSSCRAQLDKVRGTGERIHVIENFLKNIAVNRGWVDHPIEKAIQLIFERKGLVTVQELTDHLALSERAVQQMFKKYVGLSPKLFTQIVRFSRIFEIMKERPPQWMDVVVEAGYYDQSHFIRNFKDFAGEDPGLYEFDESTMANFFLKKE